MDEPSPTGGTRWRAIAGIVLSGLSLLLYVVIFVFLYRLLSGIVPSGDVLPMIAGGYGVLGPIISIAGIALSVWALRSASKPVSWWALVVGIIAVLIPAGIIVTFTLVMQAFS